MHLFAVGVKFRIAFGSLYHGKHISWRLDMDIIPVTRTAGFETRISSVQMQELC